MGIQAGLSDIGRARSIGPTGVMSERSFARHSPCGTPSASIRLRVCNFPSRQSRLPDEVTDHRCSRQRTELSRNVGDFLNWYDGGFSAGVFDIL